MGQGVIAGVVPVGIGRPLPVNTLQHRLVLDPLVVLQADGGEGERDEIAVVRQPVALLRLQQCRRVGLSHHGDAGDDHVQRAVVCLWAKAAVHGEEPLLVADIGDAVVRQDLVDVAAEAVLLVVMDNPFTAVDGGDQAVRAVACGEPDAPVGSLGDLGDVVARQPLGGGVEPVVLHPVLVDVQPVGAGVKRRQPEIPVAVQHQVLHPGGGKGRVGFQRLITLHQAEGAPLLHSLHLFETMQPEGVITHPVIAVPVFDNVFGTEVHRFAGEDVHLGQSVGGISVEAVVEAHPEAAIVVVIEIKALQVLQVLFPEINLLLQCLPPYRPVAGNAVEPRIGEEPGCITDKGDRRQLAAGEGRLADGAGTDPVVIDKIECRSREEPQSPVPVLLKEGDALQLFVVVGVGVVVERVEAADAFGGAHPVVLFAVLEQTHGALRGQSRCLCDMADDVVVADLHQAVADQRDPDISLPVAVEVIDALAPQLLAGLRDNVAEVALPCRQQRYLVIAVVGAG